MDFMNPDEAALGKLEEVLKTFEWEAPDGRIARIEQIDLGYQSKPVSYPYASLHTLGSKAEIRHLGRGAGKEARIFKIDGLIVLEHEEADAKSGYRFLTQMRWQVFLRLLEVAQEGVHGVDFLDFDEATIQTYNLDEGGYQDWGFFGQVIIPITIELHGTSITGSAGI